jgi:predicted acylesterase/phospholipase RssA
MTIKHLVISGGGPTMIKSLGACQHLEENNFWKIDDIKTIHGTSAGGIIGAVLCLKYDWETLNTYFIKRPWNDAIPFNIKYILDAYTKRGIFGKEAIEIVFKSLLLGKDLSLNITLNEFYEYSKIELYMYSFEINNFKIESISYKTYPNLALLTAIQMTCAIPILMSPVCIEDKCFIDGAVVSNYPLNYCLEILSNENSNEILGFKNDYGEKKKSNTINEKSNLLDFIIHFLYKLLFQLNTEDKQITIENEIVYSAEYISLEYIKSILLSREMREEFLQSGIESGKKFLLSKQNVESN